MLMMMIRSIDFRIQIRMVIEMREGEREKYFHFALQQSWPNCGSRATLL